MDELDCETCWAMFSEASLKPEVKQPTENVFLTTNFIDIENSPKVLNAVALVNVSKSQHYYYEWDNDPKDHFQISPCKGSIKPKTKADFSIYFTPSTLDCLYHTEIDIKIFLCHEKPKTAKPHIIDLPLTMSLKIIGNSFPEDSCGWVPQCKIAPKVLCMRPCVPGECIYATFIVEREGHLPVNFSLIHTKERNFTAHPPLGHLSENFKLFVVKFNSHSKEPGIYMEDVKIKFNNSDLNIATIKLVTTVEVPRVIIGMDNLITFAPVFPGSKMSVKVPIHNPTRLQLCYEFKIPDDMTWVEIVNPKGSVEPKCSAELQIIFKPSVPCAYQDYILCFVGSKTKADYTEIVRLQVIGSCQYGYLVATPSIQDLGECIYREKRTISFHLFNFSCILVYFRLTTVGGNFPSGDEKDVTITPTRGSVLPKGSLKIEISITPYNLGLYKYLIKCQNFVDDSDEAEAFEEPRQIILLNFEGVLPHIQVVDLDIHNGGPLFSPHWLWQMLCIDKVNEALKSLETSQTIMVKIPEVVIYSPPISVVFVVEARHGKVFWNVKLEIQCPCYQESSDVIQDCFHTKSIFMRPTKNTQNESEKVLLVVKINYELTSECTIVLRFKQSCKREVILKMPLVSLPAEETSYLSTYLNPVFSLKPVFIGDPQPPLQLFWLYNNTNYPASYSVDTMASKKIPAKGVFDCINPEGVIHPFSPHPLGIIFRPNEIKTYLMDVPVQLQRSPTFSIHLIGEGVLEVLPPKQTAMPKTIPNESFVHNKDLICCQNFVNIPAITVFSRTSRFFFIKNTSEKYQWAFQWSKFKFENIFSVRIEPEKGVIEPGEKLPMTIFIQTFYHPGCISFSIPCKVLNFSQLMLYKQSCRMQKETEEKDKMEFIITEKGKSNAEIKVQKHVKPASCYIFITVNANIVSKISIEQKLTRKLQDTLKAGKEIPNNLGLTEDLNLPLKPLMLQSVRGLLEKLLWDILYSRNVVETIKTSQKSQDFTYRQIVPESRKKREELVRLKKTLPSKHLVQKILEITLDDIVCKKLKPDNSEKEEKNSS